MLITARKSSRIFLPVLLVLLAACTAPTEQPADSYRVVNRVDIELRPAPAMVDDQPFQRSFEQRDIEGSFTESGAWSIKGVVEHNRLRCGTYEMGLQIGSGSPACTAVKWFNDIQYRTRERQCNSASLLHSGGGDLSLSREQLKDATCVRIVTRCAGTCG
ncbi:MAG: hypothetical protein ACR2QB_02595 [Gammaproteobacteria bacterium]